MNLLTFALAGIVLVAVLIAILFVTMLAIAYVQDFLVDNGLSRNKATDLVLVAIFGIAITLHLAWKRKSSKDRP